MKRIYDKRNNLEYKNKCQPLTPLSASVHQLLPLIRDGLLLDLGCGGGGQLAHFPASIGLDISFNNLKACTKFGRSLCCADIEETLPFAPGVFDSVLISHVIEHVVNPIRLCHEAFRILRPGGRVIIGMPLETTLFRLFARDNYFTDHPGHLYAFSPTGMKRIMIVSGFIPDKILFDIPMARRLGSSILQRMGNIIFPANFLKWVCANFWIVGQKHG